MNEMSFSTVSVNVQKQTIWDVLLDRIVHPERYLIGVLESSIIKKSSDVIIRRMRTTLGEVIEQITIDVTNWIITSQFVQHPLFTGTTVNRILPTQSTPFSVVTFGRAWKPKDPAFTIQPPVAGAKEELLYTKKIAERFSAR